MIGGANHRPGFRDMPLHDRANLGEKRWLKNARIRTGERYRFMRLSASVSVAVFTRSFLHP